MLFALMLTMMGITSAMGQKIYQAELDKSMFKAWDGWGADAKEVAEPEQVEGQDISCTYITYKEVGAGKVIFGHDFVYYLWYADITGTKKLTIKATQGMQFRVLFNRPEPVEGGDSHGGTTVELNGTADANGEAVFDLSSYEYIHLNAIKTGWGSASGVIKTVELEGSVKPVTGILSMINNGNAEGTDLESFPVSYDGPNNGSTANERPEIVSGGVNGSKCFKVTSYPDPTENWHTQFYIKADEVMPKGTKWKLIMSVKADNEAYITTSAQAAPRQWKGGFIDAFPVGTEWKEYSWEGEISVDDFQSIAFDLNNGAQTESGFEKAGPNSFYFDNIQFGVDLGGANPMSDLTFNYSVDVVRIDLADNTNMKDLVKAAGGKTLIFPNSCASVTWNGKTCELTSVEGRPDGNLYVFLEDMDGEGGGEFMDEDAVVKVAFTNPDDAAYHLTFKEGKWAGEAVPNFSGILCNYDFDLGNSGEFFSYLWGTPLVESADPENRSFGLPTDTKEFLITFNQAVNAETVVAKLGKEPLKATAVDESSKVIKLTRTANTALVGVVQLVISKAIAAKSGYDLDEPIVMEFSFGPLTIDPNDQPQDLLTTEAWNNTSDGGIPAGFFVKFGEEERPSETSYGSGSRMFVFAQGGDFTHGLYFREGYAEYGSTEGYELTMEAGKVYKIHFNSAMWKGKNKMTFQIMSADDPETALYSEEITDIVPDMAGAKNAINGSVSTDVSFAPETTGNYLLRWISTGFVELLLGDPTVKYVPNVMGYEETMLLNTALENAKSVLDGNSEERYDGAAFDALNATIAKYEAEGSAYTAPSQFKNAAAALDAAAQALKEHRTLCDSYDEQIKKSLDVERQNAEKKFASTELYAKVKTLNAKYNGSSKWVPVDPEYPDGDVQLEYSYDVLKDDAALTAAVNELSTAANVASLLFTEGESKTSDTGVKVLIERLRLGALTLKSLGVAEDDELIASANNALTDDNELAERIKNRIKTIVYGDLKNADSELFKATVDETTAEDVTPSYDVTVFVKNPNIYKLDNSMNFTDESVPGWTVPEGYNRPGLSCGWDPSRGTAEIAEDCMFQTWGSSYRVEQTINDLPAGVYTIMIGFGERMTDDESYLEGSFIYAKTSATPEGEDGQTTDVIGIGQSFPYVNLAIEDVVVTDGVLTIGANGGASSHTFLNDVRLLMTGKADGFDYGKAYDEVMTGVEPTTKTAKVRAIQLFDLNGRRISTAKKGIVIIQKQMSDGTIKTEKVIK
jgi:hypothetical protein